MPEPPPQNEKITKREGEEKERKDEIDYGTSEAPLQIQQIR